MRDFRWLTLCANIAVILLFSPANVSTYNLLLMALDDSECPHKWDRAMELVKCMAGKPTVHPNKSLNSNCSFLLVNLCHTLQLHLTCWWSCPSTVVVLHEKQLQLSLRRCYTWALVSYSIVDRGWGLIEYWRSIQTCQQIYFCYRAKFDNSIASAPGIYLQ